MTFEAEFLIVSLALPPVIKESLLVLLIFEAGLSSTPIIFGDDKAAPPAIVILPSSTETIKSLPLVCKLYNPPEIESELDSLKPTIESLPSPALYTTKTFAPSSL